MMITIFKLEVKKSNNNTPENFMAVDNLLLRDPRISCGARGLMLVVLALPEDSDFSPAGLAARSKESESEIRKLLNELEKFGYYKAEPVYDDNGVCVDMAYYFYERPARPE